MKEPVSTYKILMQKSLNHDIDESWIDWAIEMIETGFESENLYMLAGTIKPYNQFELQHLTDKVLDDLKLEYSNRNTTIKNYVYYLITTSIDRPDKYSKILRELKDLHQDLDYHSDYQDFFLLYYAKDDLATSENQWYCPGANRNNIDQIIKTHFNDWKTKYELEHSRH